VTTQGPSARTRARLLALLLLTTASAVAVLPAAGATAAAPVKAGWWNVATFGGAALPLPTTAAGDLHVGQGLSGPTAYAAVAYFAKGAVTAATLELKVTAGRTAGTPALQACPTKDDRWKPAQDGPVTDAPAYNCSRAAVIGVVAADGATVTFLLSEAQLSGATYSLAIVPVAGSAPFQLDLTKPGLQSLTTATYGSPTVTGSAPAAPAVSWPSGSAAVPAPAVLTGRVTTAPPAFAVAAAPQLAAATAPTPQTAAQAPPDPSAAPAAAALPPLPLSNRDRYEAGTLLALIAGALVWAFQQPATAPRLIGGMARTASPGAVPSGATAASPPRGIGRFAVVRTAPARRLL
jgi:hypothetical protein